MRVPGPVGLPQHSEEGRLGQQHLPRRRRARGEEAEAGRARGAPGLGTRAQAAHWRPLQVPGRREQAPEHTQAVPLAARRPTFFASSQHPKHSLEERGHPRKPRLVRRHRVTAAPGPDPWMELPVTQTEER